jgi:hypothetical protein
LTGQPSLILIALYKAIPALLWTLHNFLKSKLSHTLPLVEHFKFFTEKIGEKCPLFFTLFFTEKASEKLITFAALFGFFQTFHLKNKKVVKTF